MSFKIVIPKLSIIIIVFICAAATIKAQTTTEITTTSSTVFPPVSDLEDDEIHLWTSEDYPKPYPPKNKIFIIKADSGYFVSVTVHTLDLDGNKGDFLLIKPGTALHDDNKGKVFTYNLNSPRKYLIHSNSAYLSFHVLGTNADQKTGFSLTYQRVGEAITSTTENPTTAVTWPAPSASDSIYHIVYVSDKTQEDFNNPEVLNNFKTAVAEMATEYCDSNNFILTENITINNVHLYYLIQCPYTWPESDTCVKIRFALPVLVAENTSWSGYQLTTSHLEPMWQQLANKFLSKYNLSVYSEPDNATSLRKWVVISCITLILFLILLYVVKMVSHHFSPLKGMKRRPRDTSDMIQNVSRTSKMSLGPHSRQVTPPFFDNDYAVHQFEPDVGIPTKSYSYQLPLSEEDSDNEIIFTNFNNNCRNNIKENYNKESNT